MNKTSLLFNLLMVSAATTAPALDTGLQFHGVSISTFNDNTPYLYDNNGFLDASIGRGADDQFTAGFHIDAVGDLNTPWSDRLVATSTLALYTDTQYYAINGPNGAPVHRPWRVDAGSVQVLLEKSWAPWTAWYGAGVLVRGNLGGQAIQDTFHDSIGDIQFNLSYPGDYGFGPLVTGILGYQFLNAAWAGWTWTASAMGRGLWDVVGVLNDEADGLVRLDMTFGPAQFEFVIGGRYSLPGSQGYLADLYSSGMFFDYGLNLKFSDWTIEFGYAINPYGAASISDYPDYKDQNQEFHWTVTWGLDNPLPWVLRFYP